ncbi:twin transmembrane helix small protein [uncultured Shimia sp.]|uniref:twin transmembrane helix small protein n=1 Tax=uncultured Shimia sp. TaxID=573152 RepID=UPI0026379B63|nr:twin transmembrane helix small protein [uncultured Shimia sp.]
MNPSGLASDPLFWVVAVATLGVAAILMVGIGGFAKGGDFNRKHANRLMRWRIAAQAVAVALILLFVWLRSGS